MLNRKLFLCFLLLLAFSALAQAQSATATLSGAVADQQGATVPGVSITLTNVDTGLEREATTNEAGSFTIPLLPPGKYNLTAQRDGFAPFEVRNIVLNVNDERSLRIQLNAGNIRVAVQVTSEPPLINDSAAVATTVDRKFVEGLPLNGRSFQSLISLSPGVVLGNFGSASDTNTVGFSVNGQRPLANYFTVDGVSANVGTTASSDIGANAGGITPAVTVSGGTQALVPLDSMQEFTIQTSSYSAKNGRQPGAQISISTRSGTNQFHGSLFEYFRNEKLDANDWFSNRNNLPRSPLRQNDFGGVFGGPIYKNKTLFFGSYEGLRLRLPQSRVFTVFSQSFRATAHPEVAPILAATPLPNGRSLSATTGEFVAGWSDPQTTDAYSIKIDQIFKKVTIFGRYHDSPSEGTRRNLIPSRLDESILRTQTLTVGSTWVVSNTLTNDLRFNYTRSSGTGQTRLDNFGGATPFEKSRYLPSFIDAEASQVSTSVTGITSNNANLGRFGLNVNRQINIVDDVSFISGNHRWEFGGDYRYLFPYTEPLPYNLTIAVLNATTGQARYTVGSNGPASLVFPNFSLYGQDTWKLSPKLTLNYGLRWEFVPPPHSTEGSQPLTFENLDNPTSLAFAPLGTKVWETTYNNFAPRIGLAYNLRTKAGAETVLRGGFGVYYDLGIGSFGSFASNAPYSRSRIVATQIMPISESMLQPTPFSLTTPVSLLRATARNIKLPYTLQYNVAVEQSLGASQSVTLSYVGAAGRRLLNGDSFVVNIYPTPTLLTITRNGSDSNYNAMQVEYQRRLTRGFQALASYTWAKSIDSASADIAIGAFGTRVDPAFFRGPSAFDIRHNFSMAVTYQPNLKFNNKLVRALLGNWSSDTIFRAQSAPPVNVAVQQVTDFGNFPNRPDLVEGQPIYIPDPTAPRGRRLNPAAFAAVRTVNPLRLGTLGRNAVRGLGSWQLDTSLARRFPLHFWREGLNVQFRTDVFNIFNHPNFEQPSPVLGTVSSAGVFTAASTFGRVQAMQNRSLGGQNAVHQKAASRPDGNPAHRTPRRLLQGARRTFRRF